MLKVARGLTLVELLVVISIIGLLTSILLPGLARARRQARSMLGASRQRQVLAGASQYALDYCDRFPASVATVGLPHDWHWQEPMMLTGFNKRSPHTHRAMSAYLRPYIADASVLYCPHAPGPYQYLQQAWDAGDDWDNPEPLTLPLDPVIGTYCFYWNYIGYLEGGAARFRGPRSFAGGRGRSRLMVTDYFGYDHWRSWETYGRCCYGSCNKFPQARVTPGTAVSSPYWSRPVSASQLGLDRPRITLRAGYADGHVEPFSSLDVALMRVAVTADGSVPYPSGSGIGPGCFFLPAAALR